MTSITRKILIIMIGPIVGYITYKLVPPPPDPEDMPDSSTTPKNLPSADDLRGGDLAAGETKRAVIKELLKKAKYTIHKNLPLITALTASVIGIMNQEFNAESVALLAKVSKVKLNLERLGMTEKELVDFLNELGLGTSSDRVREATITQYLDRDEKWKLFQLKIKSMTNREIWGNSKNLILALVAMLIMLLLHFPSGYSSFLLLILKLFREGKISKASFDELRELAQTLAPEEIARTVILNENVQEEVLKGLTN